MNITAATVHQTLENVLHLVSVRIAEATKAYEEAPNRDQRIVANGQYGVLKRLQVELQAEVNLHRAAADAVPEPWELDMARSHAAGNHEGDPVRECDACHADEAGSLAGAVERLNAMPAPIVRFLDCETGELEQVPYCWTCEGACQRPDEHK